MPSRRRWLPHPVLSLVLLVIWLLLVNSVAPGQILLGALFGLALPLFTTTLWPQPPRIRRPGLLFQYVAVLLGDIVVANLEVARLILGRPRNLRPRLVRLPLALTEDFTITLLANTISLTPGTVTADVAPDRKHLLIHCLNVDDEAAVVARIKHRYEAPLKEIFEC